MRPHFTPAQIRSLASRYVADQNEPGRSARVPEHLDRCDRCLSAFTDEIATMAWARTHARNLIATTDLAPSVPAAGSRAPATGRTNGRQLGRRAAGRAAAARPRRVSPKMVGALAVVVACFVLTRGIGDAIATAPVRAAATAEPEPTTPTRVLATANPEPQPRNLELGQLRSAAFAIRRAKLSGDGDAPVRVASDRFVADVIPRLDPVDHWRVVQTALAAMGLYPADRVDGLYGAQTRSALREFFSDDTSKPSIRGGRLSTASLAGLLSGFGDVIVSTGPTKATADAETTKGGSDGGQGPVLTAQ